MPLETSSPICPLCRRLVSDRMVAEATRLCHECRSMIDVLRPRAAVSLNAAYVPQYAFAMSGQSAFAAPPSLPISDDAFDRFTDEADYDLVSLQPEPEADYFDDEEPSHAPAAPLPMPQAAMMTTEAEPLTGGAPAMATAVEMIGGAPTMAMADAPESFQFTQIATEPAASALPTATPIEAPVETLTEAPVETSLEAPVEAPPEAPITLHQDSASDDHAHELAQPQAVDEWSATAEKAVTDPWADPLPASEYSQNEWPLLVAREARPKRTAKWLLLAAALMIVATAAVYFIIIEPRMNSSQQSAAAQPDHGSTAIAQANEPAKPVEQTLPPQTAASSDATAQPAAAATPPAQPSSAAPAPSVSEKPTPVAPASTNPADAPQWKQALQVMASQNQAEALQVAEKLRGAGVPAYVIVADLGGRGRWFRVRIGGFATTADAQRFAAEARARAKAAGVPLKDLNVCEYEKP